MKALLLSVRPEHVYNILTGKKTLELRKSVPKDFKGWVYVYVTKAIKDYKKSHYYQPKGKEEIFRLHGIIPCRFWFDEYIKLKYGRWVNHEVGDWNYRGYMDEHLDTFKKACFSEEEVNNYGVGKDLYAWHIKNLEIFDKPMELGEFVTCYKGQNIPYSQLTCAPRKMTYVWVKEE